MATVKHPVSGKPQLVWMKSNQHLYQAVIQQMAKYKRGGEYTVRNTFALVRSSHNGNGSFTDASYGWVVTRNDFGEIREFDTLDLAKLYVESLFALEHNG